MPMLESHGTPTDPVTGLPKSYVDRDRLKAVEEKVRNAEMVAQSIVHDLMNEPGQNLLQLIYTKLVERIERLMGADEQCKVYLDILETLNAQVAVAPKLARAAMQQRLPKGVMR